MITEISRASVVHLNFRAGSTFTVPVCTLGKYSRHSIGLAGATRLTPSDFRLNCTCTKGSEVRDLLIGRVQYLYTIEPALENITYSSFQLISVTLLSLVRLQTKGQRRKNSSDAIINQLQIYSENKRNQKKTNIFIMSLVY